MKIILRITKHESHPIDQEFIGIAPIWYGAAVLSIQINKSGKRSRLEIPSRALTDARDTALDCEAAARRFLSTFGWEPSDITTEIR